MYFKQKDIFGAMSKDFVKKVMNISKTESHREGEFIFRKGDFANQFYVLLKGHIKLILGETGHIVYVVNHAGEAFGWSSLTGRDTYSAAAECLTKTQVLTWDKQDIQKIIETETANGLIFYKRLSELLGNRLAQSYMIISSTLGSEVNPSFGTRQVMVTTATEL